MGTTGSDTVFAGSIPELHDSHLVSLIFEPYAVDLARGVASLGPTRVFETAAGTGAVTRALARALPAHVDLMKAGFSATPCFETITARSRAATARAAAIACCQGTPLRTEIESRSPPASPRRLRCVPLQSQSGSAKARSTGRFRRMS